MTRVSVFLYPEEIVIRGAERLVAELLAVGADGVSVAVLYHPARRVLSRHRRISLSPAGHLAIRPRTSYGGSTWNGGDDEILAAALVDFRQECTRNGLAFHAWMVLLHLPPAQLGLRPLAATYADGTDSAHALCPSRSGTRELVVEMIEHVVDVLRPDRLDLEAVLHSAWQPDYSLTLMQDRRISTDLLSYCVCEACAELARDAGADWTGVMRYLHDNAWKPPAERQPPPPDLDPARAAGPSALARGLPAGTAVRALLFGDAEDLRSRGWSEQAASCYDGGACIGMGEATGADLREVWERALADVPGTPRSCSVNWSAERSRPQFLRDVEELSQAVSEISLYNFTLVPDVGVADFAAAAAAAKGTS